MDTINLFSHFHPSHRSKRGFTIVELLIVIVVIGILAAITIVAYSGMQDRTRMSQRQHDVASIQKALELYRTDNGGYPAHLTTTTDVPAGFAGSYGCVGCYSYSVATNGSWLKTMLDAKTIGQAPVDPINDNTNFYMYWRSAPNGFATSCQEHFYVLVVEAPGAGSLKNSRGVYCPGYAYFSTSANRAVFSNIITPLP